MVFIFRYNMSQGYLLDDAKILLKCYLNAKINNYIFHTYYSVANNKPFMFPPIFLFNIVT